MSDPSVPVEGGSANDYDYAGGDPVNNFDLAGTYCLTGKNANGSCRSISRGARRNAKAAVRWPTNASGRVWSFAAEQTGGEGRSCGNRTRCVSGSWLVVPWADAGTLGNTIVCHRNCDDELFTHEKVHVGQFQQGGVGFVAAYAWESASGGIRCDNKYERPAYATNGSC